jgi:hypothetical protein
LPFDHLYSGLGMRPHSDPVPLSPAAVRISMHCCTRSTPMRRASTSKRLRQLVDGF